MLYTGFQYDGPAAVRYPRGQGPGVHVQQEMSALELGKAEIRRQGQKIAILAFGSMLEAALEAGEAINATVVNMRFVKPLDTALVDKLAADHDQLVTIEENAVIGGAGMAVSEHLQNLKTPIKIIHLGLPDRFVEHGSSARLLADCGLDKDGILKAIEQG